MSIKRALHVTGALLGLACSITGVIFGHFSGERDPERKASAERDSRPTEGREKPVLHAMLFLGQPVLL